MHREPGELQCVPRGDTVTALPSLPPLGFPTTFSQVRAKHGFEAANALGGFQPVRVCNPLELASARLSAPASQPLCAGQSGSGLKAASCAHLPPATRDALLPCTASAGSRVPAAARSCVLGERGSNVRLQPQEFAGGGGGSSSSGLKGMLWLRREGEEERGWVRGSERQLWKWGSARLPAGSLLRCVTGVDGGQIGGLVLVWPVGKGRV